MAGQTEGLSRGDKLITGLKDALSGGKPTTQKQGLVSQLEIQNEIAQKNNDNATKAMGIGQGGFLV